MAYDTDLRGLFGCFVLCLVFCSEGGAQNAPDAAAPSEEGSALDRIWLSGQLNIVSQFHDSFPSQFSGPNSFDASPEAKVTWVVTLYTAYSFGKYTEGIFDLESAHGKGVSGALGLGGLGDLDAVTDPSATWKPYVARAQIRQVIPLGSKMADVTRSPLGLATSLPEKRLELRIGKMSLTDFFDLNSVGSDSHLQFLDYSIDNNATFDIAANSRGYTYGVLAELYEPGWAARAALAFEPTDISGHHIEWNLAKARSENFELEVHPTLIAKRSTVLRALAVVNHAQMANYRDAVTAYLTGSDALPDLLAHLRTDQVSYDFGLNGEQEINDWLRVFGRAGKQVGGQEAFQFAEADGTVAFGCDLDGKRWKRADHRIGAAFALNTLDYWHRRYLELGGTSYLLGDGGLHYSQEKTLEAYYNLPLLHGIYTALDVQHVRNPGYDASRGPVFIFGLRLHLEGDVHFHSEAR